jgi:hypothetical protein
VSYWLEIIFFELLFLRNGILLTIYVIPNFIKNLYL